MCSQHAALGHDQRQLGAACKPDARADGDVLVAYDVRQLRARAYENMIGVATVNYPKSVPDCNGHSTAFDCIAYRPDEPVSRDTLLLEAGEREGIYLTDFPLTEIRQYRAEEVHGNAYRQIKTYNKLLSPEVRPPFFR